MTDFTKPLNRPSKCCGETSEKFQGPTARLTGSRQCVLADALRTAKHQGMVDLHLRLLHPLRQAHDDVATVLLTEDLPDMVEPRLRICGAAWCQRRRAIEV